MPFVRASPQGTAPIREMKDQSPETASTADVVALEENGGFCLDNPALESVGVRITQWRPDYVELELDVAPHMLNRSRVIHGGTLCTLLDAATGYSGLIRPRARRRCMPSRCR